MFCDAGGEPRRWGCWTGVRVVSDGLGMVRGDVGVGGCSVGLFEPGRVDRGRCRGLWSIRGVVPVYPIGGYVGILGVGADRGERVCQPGLKRSQPGLKRRHVCIMKCGPPGTAVSHLPGAVVAPAAAQRLGPLDGGSCHGGCVTTEGSSAAGGCWGGSGLVGPGLLREAVGHGPDRRSGSRLAVLSRRGGGGGRACCSRMVCGRPPGRRCGSGYDVHAVVELGPAVVGGSGTVAVVNDAGRRLVELPPGRWPAAGGLSYSRGKHEQRVGLV